MAGPRRAVGRAQLDSAGRSPETNRTEKGRAAHAAAADLARPTDPTPVLDGLITKAQAAAARFQHLQGVVQKSQLREALTRTELTLALNAALIGRAEAQAAARREAALRGFARLPEQPLRRRGRHAQRLERVLVKLRSVGHALLIAQSGVWRGTGKPLHQLRHMAAYARRGPDPAAAPLALFDQAWHLAAYPQIGASGLSPLAHYLAYGAAAGHSPHPLFDPLYYGLNNAGELDASQVSPLEHFVRVGAAGGRNPHPLFDIPYYLGQAPDLAAGEDPLSHYTRTGWRQDLSPHPLFDPVWYRDQMPRSAHETPPLLHYLSGGWREGLTPHPLFDGRWYIETYPDVAETGAEPLTHFVLSGAVEGRNPNPWFDMAHHIAARGEQVPAGANPLVDYLQGGAWQVTEARPGFPTAAYLAANPELARQGMTPLEHWVRARGAP